MCVRGYVCLCVSRAQIVVHESVYVRYVQIYLYMNTYEYVCICMCMHAYINMYRDMNVCTHIYICTYICAYIYKYIHIYVYS